MSYLTIMISESTHHRRSSHPHYLQYCNFVPSQWGENTSWRSTKDGTVIRKWFAEYGRELHPKPKFLVTVEMFAIFGPNISYLLDLILFGVHNVCYAEKCTKRSSILLLRLVCFSAWQTLVHVKEHSKFVFAIFLANLTCNIPGLSVNLFKFEYSTFV